MRTIEEVLEYRKQILDKRLPQIESYLKAVDKYLYKNRYCNFKRPLYSNIYWFIVAILDLDYRGISIEFTHSTKLKTPEVNINDLEFRKFYSSPIANLNIIPRSVIDNLKPLKHFLSSFARRKRDKFLVIQDGYEVAELRREMKDYNFVIPRFFPDKGIIEDPEFINADKIIKEIGIIGWSRRWEKYLSKSYIENVVPKLNHLYFYYQIQIKEIKPVALLYSIGANNVLEEMFADIANKEGIPVIYFQHTGDRRFSSNPLVKYFEDNDNIKTERVYIEKYGSLKLQRFWQGSISGGYKHGDVLYCTSSPIETAKEYLLNVPMTVQMQNHREIINTVIESGLKLDIKVHPIKEKENYEYFKKLTQGAKGVRILKGVKAETLIDNYKVIILDFLQSAITDYVLLSNANVAFYLKDLSVVENWEYIVGPVTVLISSSNSKRKVVSNERELEIFLSDTTESFNYYSIVVLRGKLRSSIVERVKELI